MKINISRVLIFLCYSLNEIRRTDTLWCRIEEKSLTFLLPMVREKYQSGSEYNFLVVLLAWHISIKQVPSCAEIRLSGPSKN